MMVLLLECFSVFGGTINVPNWYATSHRSQLDVANNVIKFLKRQRKCCMYVRTFVLSSRLTLLWHARVRG